MKLAGKAVAVVLCLIMSVAMLTGCGSEAKKAMDNAVTSANELFAKGEKPFDKTTEETLKKAVASSEDAKDDAAYVEVTKEIETASKAYEDSIKQLKQVTVPEESFLIERMKTLESAGEVEAATEETDGNNLMNKPGAYYAYVAMRSSLVKDEYGLYKGVSPVEAGCDGGAVIEAFRTAKDAKARDEYLASFDSGGALSSGSHVVVGTLVVRTSYELTATQQKELEQEIIDALIKLE